MDDSIECPYCGCDNEITYDDHDGNDEFDMECKNCNEEFEVTTTWYPTYDSSKIEYKKCIDCGEEYRVEGKSYPKPNKY
jgi:transcription elongation factor Elf1